MNLFADDTSAFTVSDSAQNLQLSLQTVANDLSSWLKSWALTINVEKTAVMVLCTRQKVPTISIIINGSEIKQVRVQKHLGLNIDERLTWTDHVSTIVNKTSSRLGLLRRLRPRVPPLVIQTLFRTCVLPVLKYASLAWSGLGTINAEPGLEKSAAIRPFATKKSRLASEKILLADSLATESCRLADRMATKFFSKRTTPMRNERDRARCVAVFKVVGSRCKGVGRSGPVDRVCE